MGRPARGDDWSPAAARAGGFPLAGVAKWEREYPRWPHRALVVARHGSWRGALQAAGLAGPPPLAVERRERVLTAQRLEGQLVGARDRRAARRHRQDGALVLARRDVRALRRPTDPSDRQVVRELHPVVARGARPSARSYGRCVTGSAPPVLRRGWPIGASRATSGEREYPAWPSAGDVRARFGSWPAALAAAGLRPHRRAWTRDTSVTALQAWAAAHARPPQRQDWQAAGRQHPPASKVANLFGSWTAALDGTELPTTRRAWSAHEILEGLRALDQAHGRPPTSHDLRDTRATPYPPATAVARTFGSFRAALQQLGWRARWTPIADTAALAALAALTAYTAQQGRPPTCTTWRREHRRPAASVIIRRYGTWSAALAAAQIAERR